MSDVNGQITDEQIYESELGKRTRLSMAIHTHGPAGFLEQDDGENWHQSTRGHPRRGRAASPVEFCDGAGTWRGAEGCWRAWLYQHHDQRARSVVGVAIVGRMDGGGGLERVEA